MRLEFSHTIHNAYFGHQKMAKGIIYNANTHCFTTYNEKAIHVWHPITSEKIFAHSFDAPDKLSESVAPMAAVANPKNNDG